MGCPDRNSDQRIIAEVERRKAKRDVPESGFQAVEIEGSLQEVLLSGLSEADIIKIQKTDNGWQVFIKNHTE